MIILGTHSESHWHPHIGHILHEAGSWVNMICISIHILYTYTRCPGSGSWNFLLIEAQTVYGAPKLLIIIHNSTGKNPASWRNVINHYTSRKQVQESVQIQSLVSRPIWPQRLSLTVSGSISSHGAAPLCGPQGMVDGEYLVPSWLQC